MTAVCSRILYLIWNNFEVKIELLYILSVLIVGSMIIDFVFIIVFKDQNSVASTNI